jgi:hypothetical protein
MELDGRHDDLADVFTPEWDGVESVATESGYMIEVQYVLAFLKIRREVLRVLVSNKLEVTVEVLYQLAALE